MPSSAMRKAQALPVAVNRPSRRVSPLVSFFAAPGCNNNWSVWGASSRLQWDVTKSFYLGVEVMYNHMNSAKFGSATSCREA